VKVFYPVAKKKTPKKTPVQLLLTQQEPKVQNYHLRLVVFLR
jgi:hypothetical protein